MKKFVVYVNLLIVFLATICSTMLPQIVLAASDVEKVEYDGHKIIVSDQYFKHSSHEYDEHLATLSSFAVHFSMPLENPSSANDKEWYENQPKRLREFFDTIHFTNFDTNKDYVSKAEFDTIGVGIASKKIDDYTVVAVVPRSGGYFREWGNNVYLGDGSKSDYMHEGWYNAANKLLNYLDEYITKYKVKGKVKLWMTGFSRG